MVLFGRVEDRHLGTVGQVTGESTFGVHHFVAQADIGKRAAHHNLVVAAARSVGIEIGRLHAVSHQVFAGGAIFLYGTGGRDVVGGDAVAEHGQHARLLDVLDRGRLQRHVIEIWRLPNVGGVFFPRVSLALRNGQ